MSGSSLVPHGAELTATGLTRSFNLMPGSSLVPHGARLTATGLTRSVNLMPGSSLVPHGARLTATGLTRSFNLMPGSSLVPHGARLTATGLTRSFNLMPGGSLLSHGESPHYHRRYGVSLLSSAWGQVGPPRYGRQANSLCSVLCLLRSYCVGCSCEPQSHTYVCSFRRCVCRLVSAQNPSDSLICI
jgi:hypothetical protein